MDEFPANSRRPPAREPKDEKKVTRVTETEVIRRKKPLGKKMREVFIGGEAGSVWSYVLMDVLVPAAKDMIADAASQGVERMIFGESRTNRRPSRTGGTGTYTAYNRFAPNNRGPQREEPRNMSRRGRSTHEFDEIILATRVEAEEVIDRLFDLVGRYESASVSDLYSLVGVSGNFVDEKWGWTDLRGAGVERVRNGYLLDLPRPEPLD